MRLYALEVVTAPRFTGLSDFGTVIIGTERFVDTVRRLGFHEVGFRELPVR